MTINTFGIWLLVAIIVILIYQNFLLRLDLNELSNKHNTLCNIVDVIVNEIDEFYNDITEEINIEDDNKTVDKL